MELDEAEIEARFSPADRLVPLTVLAAAAVMPELAEGGPQTIESLAAALTERVAPMLEQYRNGDALAFPMVTNLVLATP